MFPLDEFNEYQRDMEAKAIILGSVMVAILIALAFITKFSS